MAKFCGKCGSALDENTGFCLRCDAKRIEPQKVPSAQLPQQAEKKPDNIQQTPPSQSNTKEKEKNEKKSAKKAKKKEKRAQRPWWKKLLGFFLRCILWLLLLALIAAGILYTLLRIGLVDMSVVDNALVSLGITKQYQAEFVDADEYFRNNASVVSVIDASTSEDVLSEAEVSAMLRERGFTDYPITCNYAMNGEYDAQMSFSETSSTKHPTYETYYITAAGDLWTIFVINDAITAMPVSYSLELQTSTEVLFSETSTLTSYDSVTNQFYETIPNDSSVDLKIVDRIDAQTLESLTYGEIDGL